MKVVINRNRKGFELGDEMGEYWWHNFIYLTFAFICMKLFWLICKLASYLWCSGLL